MDGKYEIAIGESKETKDGGMYYCNQARDGAVYLSFEPQCHNWQQSEYGGCGQVITEDMVGRFSKPKFLYLYLHIVI